MKALSKRTIIVITTIISLIIWFITGFFICKTHIKNQLNGIITDTFNLNEPVKDETTEKKYEEVNETSILDDADVRNVKRWMNKKEVKKYEWIKTSDIIIEKDDWNESYLQVDWKFWWRSALIKYAFYKDQLYQITTIIEKGKAIYYSSIINSLNKKYGNWEDLSYYDDVHYLSSSATRKNLVEMFDTRLSIGYIALMHDWTKWDTEVNIMFWNWDIFDMWYGEYIMTSFNSISLNSEVENNKTTTSDI